MRTIAIVSTLLLATTFAAADDDHERAHCTIVEINGAPHALEVSEAFRNGARWAEYNCRVDSEKHIKTWVNEHGACDGKYAVKWKLELGPRSNPKKMDMTALCSKMKR